MPRANAQTEGTDCLDLFETMENCRAMRRLKPDPVPDELDRQDPAGRHLRAVGGNAQKWRFLVIKDRKIKEAPAAWYKKAYDEIIGPRYSTVAPPPGVSPEKFKRQHSAVEYLTDHFADAPVWIVACLDTGASHNAAAGASIYRPCRTWCWPAARSASARR
jgi:nitroreductase